MSSFDVDIMKSFDVNKTKARMDDPTHACICYAKRITAGILVGNGIHSPNNPSVLAKVQQKEQEKFDKMMSTIRKTRNELLAKTSKVASIQKEKGREKYKECI
jgi:hypothetical protein